MSNTSIDMFGAGIPELEQIEKISKFNKLYRKYCKDYKNVPTVISEKRRVIAIGDIHGDYELAIRLLKIAKVINHNLDWIGGDTHVVQVGDQVDRCRPTLTMNCKHPDATYQDEASDIKILLFFTDLDRKAQVFGGRVISLLGNHELMNVFGDFGYVSALGIKEFENKRFKSPEDARADAFKEGHKYARLLGCTRNSAVIIGSLLFIHAGMINQIAEKLEIDKKMDLDTINIAVKLWLLGLIKKENVADIVSGSAVSMFWTRILGSLPAGIPADSPQCINNLDKVLKIFDVDGMVIGHTPQSFMSTNGINKTCGKIWRVDVASSRAFHGFDQHFTRTGKIDDARKPQVLEILNGEIFNVLT